jgi:hypothetical protein
MSGDLYAFCGKRVLKDKRKVLQNHAPRQVGQLGLEIRALASDSSTYIDKDGRFIRDGFVSLFFDKRLKVDNVQPNRLSAEGSHPQPKVGEEVGAVIVNPFTCGKIRLIDNLEWSIGIIIWVLKSCVSEKFGSFDDGRRDDMKSASEFSVPG